jgi:acetyl-CoA carboxylase biotin carboxyl carrier protein
MGKLDSLSDAEIDKISRLVEVLDKSAFGFMTLELADFRLIVGVGSAAPEVPPGGPSGPQAPAQPAASAVAPPPAPQAVPLPAAVETKPSVPSPIEGTVEVTATTMGRFYSRPDPNSAPFVGVGAPVKADSTIGIIEVMKLFNGVIAGVDGTVVEICVEDAELVEYGQVLMRIRPAS